MSDPWTDAWAEAAASVPPARQIYATLELFHPTFVDVYSQPFSVRLVQGVVDDVELTLEPDAPLDGGESVVWTAVNFSVDEPEIAERRVPEAQITIDNVARHIAPYLEAALEVQADIEVLYRQWVSDDLTAPAYGPVRFVMKAVTVTGAVVRGAVSVDNLNELKFPNAYYTLDRFPGLRGA